VRSSTTLLTRPFWVQSQVSAADFRLFLTELEGSDPEITHENSAALKLLCDEFKFPELGHKIDAFADRWTSVIFEAETLHVLRDTLVQMCSKFRDCQSLLASENPSSPRSCSLRSLAPEKSISDVQQIPVAAFRVRDRQRSGVIGPRRVNWLWPE
jgi:hypothetical protein